MKINFMTFLQGISMFTGWLTKSAADGKIDGKEWAELALGLAALLGLSTDVVLPQPPQLESDLAAKITGVEAAIDAAATARPSPYPPGKGGPSG